MNHFRTGFRPTQLGDHMTLTQRLQSDGKGIYRPSISPLDSFCITTHMTLKIKQF